MKLNPAQTPTPRPQCLGPTKGRGNITKLFLVFACVANLFGIGINLMADESQIPESPSGALAKRFLKTVQSGSHEDMEKFVNDYYSQRFLDFAPAQNHVDMLLQLHKDLNGAHLQTFKVVDQSVNLAFGRAGDLLDITINLSADDPPKIDGMMVRPEEMSEATPQASTNFSPTDALSGVKAELQRRAEEDKFSGAVLIAKDGQPVFQGAYGYADRQNMISNTVDTKFRFGSMGKMFTAVAVLQLVQAGKIKLDASIARYLPDYPNKEVAAVTIFELLTHTGGTGDIFSPEFEAHRQELKELKDYLTLYGNRGVQFKPGTDWDYSNYGFILLGRIVEVVSGQTYYDYVREHIFKPAGMDSTGNLPEDQKVPGLSIGYTAPDGPGLRLIGTRPGQIHSTRPESDAGESSKGQKGPLRSTTGSLPYRGTSAGGGYSTVGDFLKFVNALTLHQLLLTLA